MPQDVLPAAAPYPRSMLGWDEIDFRVISVDTDGRVIPSPLVVPFNYVITVRYIVQNLNAAAGWNQLSSAVVPGPNPHVITNIYAFDLNTAVTNIAVGLWSAGARIWVGYIDTPAIQEPCLWSGHMVVPVGDQVIAGFNGCVLNDDIFLHVVGHEMLLDW